MKSLKVINISIISFCIEKYPIKYKKIHLGNVNVSATLARSESSFNTGNIKRVIPSGFHALYQVLSRTISHY